MSGRGVSNGHLNSTIKIAIIKNYVPSVYPHLKAGLETRRSHNMVRISYWFPRKVLLNDCSNSSPFWQASSVFKSSEFVSPDGSRCTSAWRAPILTQQERWELRFPFWDCRQTGAPLLTRIRKGLWFHKMGQILGLLILHSRQAPYATVAIMWRPGKWCHPWVPTTSWIVSSDDLICRAKYRGRLPGSEIELTHPAPILMHSWHLPWQLSPSDKERRYFLSL